MVDGLNDPDNTTHNCPDHSKATDNPANQTGTESLADVDFLAFDGKNQNKDIPAGPTEEDG
jgi:hypothetical protein